VDEITLWRNKSGIEYTKSRIVAWRNVTSPFCESNLFKLCEPSNTQQ
jgi:hypothetical protein